MIDHPIKSPKKLIEVALPLDAINAACAYEKMPGIGAHPRGLHLWWARRPLAAARAVIFSQLVNDPEDLWRSQFPGVEPNRQTRGHWTKARAKLFKIIEDLVLWENTTNEEALEKAREEIRKSWRDICDLNKEHPQASELFNPEKMPGLHDPFAGGGAIPLEAQRLGLNAYASDLNPVAVLINKAMIEIPPKFVAMQPVNPGSTELYSLGTKQWHSMDGLSADIVYYGDWVWNEARRRLSMLYPQQTITEDIVAARPDLKELSGKTLSPIAWLWARTVVSPNPAFGNAHVPLVNSFVLSNVEGNEAYVEVDVREHLYSFSVKRGKATVSASLGTKANSRGANFRCVLSGSPISAQYIRGEAQARRLKTRLMAIVANGDRSRVYLSPSDREEEIAYGATPTWKPDFEFFQHALGFRVGNYGMSTWADVFTSRQLLALETFGTLIGEVWNTILADASSAGIDAREYANAVCTYLAFALDRCADFSNTLTRWVPGNQKVMNLFGKQTVSMTWDFPEAAILEETVGGFKPAVKYVADCLKTLRPAAKGFAVQASAQTQTISRHCAVSTDPPYYDNIGYADLSDFFYVWLRKGLREIYPDLFATIGVPKSDELVATPVRNGTKKQAEEFFLKGMTKSLARICEQAHPACPVTIYYAFKQAETKNELTASTGWVTFLSAIIESGMSIEGTWPLRSEQEFRMRGLNSNALASSILLVCKKRVRSEMSISRREFIRELNSELPLALDTMTRESEGLTSPVAPVDLSQAIIGPGMAIFSKYSAVLEADGTPMTVRTALQLINRFLAEDDFDADTQFCLHWFDAHGWDQGVFGEADVLARAKATSVNGLVEVGVLRTGGGKVQLLRPAEFLSGWMPENDDRIPIWEVLHQLIRALRNGGETEAGRLLSQPSVQARAEAARQLAYRLYTMCERKGWAEDARAYNEIVTSWSGIESAASKEPGVTQRTLFET